MSRANEPPTLYEWAGGGDAFERLTEVFYRRIPDDELLADLFADMPAEHPHHVAQWLTEVFGGPARYIEDHGGYPAHGAQSHGVLDGRYQWLEEGIVDPSGYGPLIADQPEEVAEPVAM